MNRAGEYVFTAVVEPVEWGRSTYTVVRVPEELAAAARAVSTRRVGGTLDGIRVNLAVNQAPVVPGPFLWAGRTLLRKLGVSAGDVVEARLAPVDADVVEADDDVLAALERAELLGAWEAMRPGLRRRLLHRVDAAMSDAARRRRIDDLVDEVARQP